MKKHLIVAGIAIIGVVTITKLVERMGADFTSSTTSTFRRSRPKTTSVLGSERRAAG